jgi:cell division transport system permease protein
VFRRLGYFARETAISLRRNLLMTLAGVLTVAVSLFLFGGVLLTQRLVDNGTARWRGGTELEIFMNVDATPGQIQSVQSMLQQRQDAGIITRFNYLNKQLAYQEFQRLFTDAPDILTGVTPEQLPTSFRVVPVDAADTETIDRTFSSYPGVANVLTAGDFVDQLLSGTRTLRGLFLAAAVVLLFSALFLIINTIRLATFARRREIQVMRLVGATNWFIRVPFMLEGLIEGALGAGLAFLGVWILKVVLSDITGDGTNLFNTFYLTDGDAIGIGTLVMVVGASVGLIGSALGMRRFLEV